FDEQKPSTHWVVGMHGGLRSLNRERVHDFERCGQHSGCDDVADRLAREPRRSKCSKQGLTFFGAFHDAEADLCSYTECSLGTHEDAGEIVTGCVRGERAEGNEVAVGEHDLERECVGDGEAVFETMCAAGIFSDISADRANRLRRGIGRIEIPLGCNTLGDMSINYTGLNDDQMVGDIDLENPVHASQADNDAISSGKGAATQSGSGTSADEGNLVPCTNAHSSLHVLRASR